MDDSIPSKLKESANHEVSDYNISIHSKNFDTSSVVGPVVRLPVETKILMRCENHNTCSRHQPKKEKPAPVNKLQTSCPVDSLCTKRLAEVDKKTKELRERASKLARREAERIELLERAEAAWFKLELGYQKKIETAEENEQYLAKQITKTIDERNRFKEATMKLVKRLKEVSEQAEKDRDRLMALEEEVRDIACEHLRLREAAAKSDNSLTEQQCQAQQLDRELQYKEEQARRKVIALQGDVDSARGLTIEVERAMRAELAALKDQMTPVSKELLREEAENKSMMDQLDKLREEKMQLINSLDGCKDMCDKNMQKRVDELKKKREELLELQNRVIACQCKLPQDVAVEVKRTPSFAALCKCSVEDKLTESCSCTSLRSQLLSNLFADLFRGLQSELGGAGAAMPCELLKCLEDRHNWDKASQLKTNLRRYFANLLVGELDIAIATSIEKYHARWVGECCVDSVRQISERSDEDYEGLQERVIERRAQKLATKLAEQLFKEKSDQLEKKAKDIVASGPPPCECKPDNQAVFHCSVKAPTTTNLKKTQNTTPASFKRTIQNVNELKAELAGLKKDTIKKEDLKQTEDRITKLIQKASKPESKQVNPNQPLSTKDKLDDTKSRCKHLDLNKQKKKINRLGSIPPSRIEKNSNGLFSNKKIQELVNLCLCSNQQKTTKQKALSYVVFSDNESKINRLPELLNHGTSPISVKKLPKPVIQLQYPEIDHHVQSNIKALCASTCECFHNVPSGTSINNLLQSLKTWKNNLGECEKHRKPFDTIIGSINNELAKNDTYEKELAPVINIQQSLQKFNCEPSCHNDKMMVDKTLFKDTSLSPQSEYMGAVNLDKSNENYSPIPTVKSGQHDNIISEKNIRFLKSSLYKNTSSQKTKQRPLAVLYKTKSLVFNSDKETSVKENTANVAKIDNNQENCLDTNKINETSKHSPCTDYDINFLGVTLTNIKSISKLKKGIEEKELYNRYGKNVALPTKLDKNYNNTSYQNKYKNDKLKSSTKRSLDKSELHSTDTSSLDKNECICCCNKDEHRELEVNTYNLLEDYLKNHISKFRNSICKSSCITQKEEADIYSDIISKIKDLITQTTKHQMCDCDNENNTNGSWTRVYGLLQEYLKIKLKRIQCTCRSPLTNNKHIYPNILENVFHLIDNDIQKLKTLCNCSKLPTRDIETGQKSGDIIQTDEKNFAELPSPEVLPNTQKLISLYTSQMLPKKDKDLGKKAKDVTCNDKGIGSANNFKVNKLISSPKIEDILNNLQEFSNCVVNKSCEANEGNLTGQKLEKVTSCHLNKVYVTDCSCRCVLTEPYLFQNNKNSRNIAATNEKHVSVSNAVKKYDPEIELNDNNKPVFPYIGCTINCSCDPSFGCICTKAHVQVNDEKIKDIWNSITDYSNISDKLSYIMRNVSQKVKTELVEYTGTALDVYLSDENPTNSINLNSETQTNVHDDDYVLIFKGSDCTVEKVSNKTSIKAHSSKINDQYIKPMTCSSFHSCCANIDCNDEATRNKNTLYSSLYLPIESNSTPTVVSQIISNNASRISLKPSVHCGCVNVPMCHVKMLVTDIEYNLKNLKCMCDTMSPNVCPIHSNKIDNKIPHEDIN
ncbi:uncharacterized protein LOC126971324 isoform X2 [Leptidea sinapis]|nr:uncharacterized protein LOC126971324 isoform X2 [Leptidea sinapis]